MLQVYETVDAISCAETIQKKLVMEYIRQVNSQIYSSNTLRDQMQALVLAVSEILVDKMSEEAYPQLKNFYEL